MPPTFTVVESSSGFHLFNQSLGSEILCSPNLGILWEKVIAISEALGELVENNFDPLYEEADYVPEFNMDYSLKSVSEIESHLSRMNELLEECRCYGVSYVGWGTGPCIWIKEWVPRRHAKPIMAFRNIEEARKVMSEIFLQIKEKERSKYDIAVQY